MATKSSTDTLAALDVVTQSAKRYATRARRAADAGSSADATLYDVRSETLTRYATHVLETLYRADEVDRVERHRIDGREQYCLVVGDWSFHVPVDVWDARTVDATDGEPGSNASREVDATDGEPESVPNFSPSAAPDSPPSAAPDSPPSATSDSAPGFDASPSAADDLLMPEVDALRTLCPQFGSVNDVLVQPFVERTYRSTFAGWPSVPGALEQGSIVSERQLLDERLHPFLFAVGDRFETIANGPVEILDRYGQWLPHRWHGGGMAPRPVYDVRVDTERRDAVREETIHDDWQVAILNPANPGVHLDGRLGDLLDRDDDSDPGFRSGDVVVIDPEWADGGPHTFRVGPLTASWSLVLCELAPTDEDGFGAVLAIEEFVDDIVAVYADRP